MDFKCSNKECKNYNVKESKINICTLVDKDNSGAPISRYFNSLGKGRAGKEIKCSICETPLTYIEEKKTGFPTIFARSFNSLTSQEKKEVLKKRSRDYDKRNKESREFKKALDNGEIK